MRSRPPAFTRYTLAALFLVVAAPLAAQDNPAKQAYINDLNTAERKFVALAEAIPESAYNWRPGEGVRSVAEVFTHIAFAQYLFGEILGTPMPADIKQKYPNPDAFTAVTDKAQILELLRSSFAHGKSVISGITEDKFGTTVKMFGRDTPFPSALLVYITHNHEHLGQQIAYARTNDVTPPWSAGN